jgi:hypothetical protein
MAVIERNNVINASAGGGIFEVAGAPGAGTNEVQTLTIGGTPTGGTFTLALGAQRTGAISWNATNATLIGNMNTALDAVFGTASIVAAVGTMTNGIGTATLTFSGNEYAKTGVSATPYQAPKGALVIDTTNGALYQNTGTAYSPTWTSR